MLALIIIGVIVGIITLIMLIPVGADIAFEDSELRISAKACGVLMQIYPKPPEEEKKPKKAKKPKKPKAPKAEQLPEEKKPLKLPNFNKEELLELARAGLGAIGKFGRKINVDRFLLHYTAAGNDPYDTAMNFAYVNAALSILSPMCRERFEVKNSSVRTEVDFTKDSMELDFGLAMTIRIGQMMGIAIETGIKALRILMRNKKRIKAEQLNNPPEQSEASANDLNPQTPAALPAEGESSAQSENPVNTEENKEKENIQAEERNDSNG